MITAFVGAMKAPRMRCRRSAACSCNRGPDIADILIPPRAERASCTLRIAGREKWGRADAAGPSSAKRENKGWMLSTEGFCS